MNTVAQTTSSHVQRTNLQSPIRPSIVGVMSRLADWFRKERHLSKPRDHYPSGMTRLSAFYDCPVQVADVDDTIFLTRLSASIRYAYRRNAQLDSPIAGVFSSLNGKLCLTDIFLLHQRACAMGVTRRGTLKLEFAWSNSAMTLQSSLQSVSTASIQYVLGEQKSGCACIYQKLQADVTMGCLPEDTSAQGFDQFAQVLVELQVTSPVAIREIVAIVSQYTACTIYGLHKPEGDTEVLDARANVKYIEEVAQDIYTALRELSGVQRGRVHFVNLESGTNYRGVAEIGDLPSTMARTG